MTDVLAQQKQVLRKTWKTWRQSLTTTQVEMGAFALQQCFWQKIHEQQHNIKKLRIGFYKAMPGEVETDLLLQDCLDQGIDCFFPVMSQNKQDKLLRYAKVDAKTLYKPSVFNVLEPQVGVYHEVNTLTHILVPALAVTQVGERLGLGAGYYDVTIAHLRSFETHPVCWGVVYAPQCVATLPQASWDQRLDALLAVPLDTK